MTKVLPPQTSWRVEPSASQRTAAPRLRHLRALDGLRGVAVLAVVLYHFSPATAPGGFLGVDVFFVLSGFLITSLLVNEWEGRGRISFPKFWARRARRLLPALFLVLGVVGVFALLKSNHAEAHHIGEDGLATLGYVANWHFISSGQSYVERLISSAPSPLRHTWSLAIEEQFYLLWPMVVGLVAAAVTWATRRRPRNGRHFRYTLVAVCFALGAASFVRMVTLFNSGGDANRVFYGTDTRAFLLLLGAALGALTAGVVTITRRGPRFVVITGGCVASAALAVTMAKLVITDPRLYQWAYGGIAVLIALVLVAAVQPGPNPLGLVLRSRPLVGLGLISYGVYLWHWPITVWLDADRTHLDGVALFALRSVVTLATSLASYKLVEQPIRRGWRPRWKTLRPVALAAVISAVLAGLLLTPVLVYASINPPPRIPPSRASKSVATTYATVPRCHGPAAARQAPATMKGASTTTSDGKAGPLVELVGNSVAIEVLPCLREIIKGQGARFESVAQSAAPPCTLLPALRKQVANPATRPDIAIWFAFDWYSDLKTCNTNWLLQVNEAVRVWKQAGTHIYLVPIVPNFIPTSNPAVFMVSATVGAPAQTPEFRAMAAADPTRVSVIDAGLFIRDAKGAYQWRMPCLPGGEPGCGSDHTVGVRYPDGFHFCTDQGWNGTYCAPEFAAGERRAAAAIALQLTGL